jgi:hypothetical protein
MTQLTDEDSWKVCGLDHDSEGSKKLPDDVRLLPKHVGASIYSKGVVQSVHIVGHFY